MMNIADTLALLDRESPNTGNLPVANVIAIPHSGSRSVAAWLASAGYYTRLIHLQQHYHRPDFVQELINTEYCVLAMRDPLLTLLSTQARADDTISAVLKSFDELFALTLPADRIRVETDARLTDIGNFGNYAEKTAYQQGRAAVMNIAPWFAELTARATAFYPALESMGYTNLMWWS